MHCPQLPVEQSLSHGENRLEKAAQTLGKDVLKRLIIFVLYTLGFNRELIAKLFGYQVAGVKTLVDRVLINGLEGFCDHRKTKIVSENKPSVAIADTETHKEINLSEAVIAVPKDDILARKIISVTLVETGSLSNLEGAKILDYTPQAFGRLREKYRFQGSYGLIDQRQGQKSDYKVTPEVKAEILFQICNKVRENTTFSSE
ncbi:MAG: hypothetical protein KGZ79_04185, partial [Dethiobacter sp.]|nr:hypothetical protein [Dethiobacter sp.]